MKHFTFYVAVMTVISCVSTAHAVSGLILWNEMGSNDEVTNSASGPDGQIQGTIDAYGPGIFGNAAHLRGSAGEVYFDIPYLEGKHLGTDALTISFWAKCSYLNRPEGFIMDNLTPGGMNLRFTQYNSTTMQGGLPAALYGLPHQWDTNWHHYAMVLQTNGNSAIYVDGTAIVSTNNAASIGMAYSTRIVLSGEWNLTGGYDWDGYIDNVKVWNFATNDFSPPPTNAVVAPTLILWNEMGSNDEVTNSAIGPDGRIFGTIDSYGPGIFGNAAHLRGSAGEVYFDIPYLEGKHLGTDALTISFWAKCSYLNRPEGFIMDSMTSGGMNLRFTQYNSTTMQGGLPSALYGLPHQWDTNWHHYAMVLQTNGNSAIYVDGTAIVSTNNAASIGMAYSTRIVLSGEWNLTGGYDWDGYIDNVKVWNFATNDFSPPPTNAVVAPSLILWNKMGSNDEVTNSAIGPDGEILGTIDAYGSGIFGKAAHLRGSAGEVYFDIPYLEGKHLGTDAFTISFWAKCSYLDRPEGFIMDNLTPGGMNLRFTQYNSTTIQGGLPAALYGLPHQWDTNWHHYAMVLQTNGNSAIYVDGTAIVSTNNDASIGMAYSTRIVLSGEWNLTGGYDWDGYIDEVKAWNFAKTNFTGRTSIAAFLNLLLLEE